MYKKLFYFALFGLALSVNAKSNYTDEQIKQQIINNSIASYSGSCPCPYNVARNGIQCGRRSAYSKPGGASPICYPQDVSKQMVNRYRSRNGH